MRFSYKILVWTIVVMSVAFGVGGYLFVNYVFESSMEREVGQAMDESRILQFAFETAALNIPSRYDVLQDSTVEQIGSNLEKGQGEGSLLRLSDEHLDDLLNVHEGPSFFSCTWPFTAMRACYFPATITLKAEGTMEME